MAEEQSPPPAAAEAPKKGLPIKTIGVIGVMLVLEAALIVGAFMMFGKPSEVKGVELEHGPPDEGEKIVELPVLAERFTNGSSGRMWVWDTEVIIKAKQKHAGEAPAEGAKKDDGHGGGGHGEEAAGAGHGDHAHQLTLREELKNRMAEVRTGIGAIFASAQHSYFTEPGRETLSRQVLEYLRKTFGHDAEGNERIQEVLIPRCLGFASDY